MIVSVTRLRLRSIRFLLGFIIDARRSERQAQSTAGCLGTRTRKTAGLAFWTLTFWESEASLRAFVSGAPHRKIMPKLVDWCDEAAVARWVHDEASRPTWDSATTRLREHGRL